MSPVAKASAKQANVISFSLCRLNLLIPEIQIVIFI